MTRDDIYNQVEERKRVLERLHDQLTCLDRAEATRLDAKPAQAESGLALLMAQRADLPAAGTPPPTTLARRVAQNAPTCAPPSAAATPSLPSPPFTLGFADLVFVHTSIRQLVSAMGIKDDEERSTVVRAAYATQKYFPDHTLREALDVLGSISDLAAMGAILHLVDTMRGFTLRNPDHVWPSVHQYEQFRARASRRPAGCSDGHTPRKNRFNDRDPDDHKNDNSSSNNNDNAKIKPTPRSAGRSKPKNSGRSSRSTQRQLGHTYSATSPASEGYDNTTQGR